MTLSVYAALVTALGFGLFLRKALYNYQRLPKVPFERGALPESVSIIIPARNEEAVIERAISGFDPEMVIVVDDASTDRTAELAAAAGARVIPAPPLPAGHLGKPNACMAGAEASEAEWLLFIDADTWYERVFLTSLIRFALERNLEMASVFLRQECRTLPEKMLLPYAMALYFTGVNAASVNSRRPTQWLANGQCLLVRREIYQRLGGHRAVASSVVEDVALAKIAAGQGIRSVVARAEHLGHVRMYDSFGAIWRGLEKNSFRFLQLNPLTAVQVILASILLTSYLPVLLWLISDHLRIQAAIYAVLPMVALAPWYGSFATLLAPVAIYLFQAIALNAMFATLTGRKSVWKGRQV